MNEQQARHNIRKLLLADHWRMAILKAVSALQLPDGYIGAGFLRNLIWDHLHEFAPTALNDIDVVYFDSTMGISETQQQQKLSRQFPGVVFDIKNQARMHLKHGHTPYRNSAEAMSYWVEQETAIGVILDHQEHMQFVAPFGLARLFAGNITPNPNAPVALFQQRIMHKNWLTTWPNLNVAT